jgi:hypothetical protein
VQTWLFDHTSASIDEDRFLDHAYKVNVMLATEGERNRDMGDYCFMNSYGNGTDQIPTDTALAWLCNQYGLLDKVQFALKSLPESDSALHPVFSNDAQTRANQQFVLSVIEEVYEFTHCMGGVTILAEMTLRDCEAIASAGSYLIVPDNATLGIFNPWVGCGSLMSIDLPDTLIVPHNMISHVWAEKTKVYGSDVDEVYGMVSTAWKSVKVKTE